MLNLEEKKEIAKMNKFVDENRKQNGGNRKSVVWNNEKKYNADGGWNAWSKKIVSIEINDYPINSTFERIVSVW